MSDQTDWTPMPPEVIDALRRLLRLIRPAPEALVSAGRDRSQVPNDDAVLDEFAGWLYARWYTDDATQQSAAVVPGRANLASALAVTVASSGQWETGWVALQSSPNGDCVASSRSVTRQLLPGQYANTARPGIAPRPGDGLAVCTLLDWVDDRTGFWHMQSRAGEPTKPLMRVYWNVDWPHAGHVLKCITEALDGQGIRYALKCPFRALDYRRIDAVVVYVERAMWEDAKPAIVRVAGAIEHWLRSPIPPLTRAIGPGAAWSEDPGGTLSFGESRCRALAPAVRALVTDGAAWTESDGLQVLLQSLRDARIDPRQPWLANQA